MFGNGDNSEVARFVVRNYFSELCISNATEVLVILVYLISFTVSLIIILAKKNILGTFTCQRSNNVEINVFTTSQTTGTSFTSEMTFLVFPFFQISSDLKTWLRSLISANQNVDGKSRKIKIEI